MINFILKSYLFKRILILTLLFFFLTYFTNILFDKLWVRSSSIPVTNLTELYKIPVSYNNTNNINLKYVEKDKIAIEGNKKFKLADNNKNFDYYDTASIKYPDKSFDYTNKIYLKFEDSNNLDSISLVVSKSESKELYWKQVFLSSVIITNLNEFSNDTAEFRIKKENLIESSLLADNDTLINQVLYYFNTQRDSLHLGDCGTNSLAFQSVCNKYNLPCRIVSLQGGDANFAGLNANIGYPLHVICEIYSSKNKKWYVIDPTYGLRYKEKNSNEYMSTVEISNKNFFALEKDIIQDSILFTKKSLLERDYFKFYENAFFKNGILLNYFPMKFLQVFYNKFNFKVFHYTNSLKTIKNGYYYLSFKSLLYIIISLMYFNLILFLLTRRLFSVKKPVT